MEHTFEDKVAIVASSFYNRFEEDGEPEILQKIFESHDLSGAIALGVIGGDIEIKSDEARGWIEDTYNVLSAIFDFPESAEQVEADEEKPKKQAPKKKLESVQE
jgi:hypothetical protein